MTKITYFQVKYYVLLKIMPELFNSMVITSPAHTEPQQQKKGKKGDCPFSMHFSKITNQNIKQDTFKYTK